MDKAAFPAYLGYVLIVASIVPQVIRIFLTKDASSFTILFPAVLTLALCLLMPSVWKSGRNDLRIGTIANIISVVALLVSVVLYGGKLVL